MTHFVLSSSFVDQNWFIVLMLVVFFGLIVLAVILIKKYVAPFKNNEKPKSDKEIAEEEVKRMVVDMEDEPKKDEELDEASKELDKKSREDQTAPDKAQVIAEEVNRSTRPVEDQAAAKAMAKYAEEHPEEAIAVSQDDKQDEKKDKK